MFFLIHKKLIYLNFSPLNKQIMATFLLIYSGIGLLIIVLIDYVNSINPDESTELRGVSERVIFGLIWPYLAYHFCKEL